MVPSLLLYLMVATLLPGAFHSPIWASRKSRSPCLAKLFIRVLLVVSVPGLAMTSEITASTFLHQERVPCPTSQPGDSFIGFPTATGDLSVSTSAAQQAFKAGDRPPKLGVFPPYLDWGEKLLFSPSALTLTVANHYNHSLLRVFPPYSTNRQFYVPEFRQPKVMEPGEELSLRVVFLPLSTGAQQGALILQTSSGGFVVELQGSGASSPYRLSSLQKRLNTGDSVLHSVRLYNPHAGHINVKEVRAWPADSDNRTLILTNPLNNKVGISRCCSPEISSADGTCGCSIQIDDSSPRYQLNMKPEASWRLDPGDSVHVVELEFKAAAQLRKESRNWNWNGFIYFRLSFESSAGEATTDQLVLPFTVRGEEQPALEAVPDVVDFGILSRSSEVKKQGILLRNSGNEFVQIEHMSHSFGGRRSPVVVRYKKGLVIHPGTQVQVAIAWYKGTAESLSAESSLDSGNNFELVFHTNSTNSRSKFIRVPYQVVVLQRDGDCEESDTDRVVLPISGLDLQLSLLEKLERRVFARQDLDSGILPSGQLDVVQTDGRHQLVVQSPPELPLLMKASLEFPAVQVGSSELLWLSVSNPTERPVSVKLYLSYEAEADTSRCKCSTNSVDCTEGSQKRTLDQEVFSVQDNGITELVLGARQDAALGPLLFRPSRRCSWTGLLALKNNLTDLEWVTIQGTGSSAELSFLDDNLGLPVEELQLSPPALDMVSTVTAGLDENLSRLSERLSSVACKQRVNGSFVAKNTGDVPLKVHSVALLNGGCSWKGFELGSCEGFSLGAGETTELKLFYRPDYVSAQVKHGLQLVTSIGTVNIPVLVVLPDHMLRLCASIPFYFKYRSMVLYGLAFILLCFLIFKAGSKRLNDGDFDSGLTRTSSLPFFREEAFRPLVPEDSSNLSKIRVKVSDGTQDEQPEEEQPHQCQSSDPMTPRGMTISTVISEEKSLQEELATRTSTKSNKRKKRRRGPVTSVKDQEESSSSAPTTPLSRERPVSPSFPCEEVVAAGAPVTPPPPAALGPITSDKPLRRAKVAVVSNRRASYPSTSAVPPASSGTSHWVPKAEKHVLEFERGKRSAKAITGDWVTVARKSAEKNPTTSGGGTGGGGGTCEVKKPGPALTQSASFPGRNDSSEHLALSQSQMSPSARAPGSKIIKNSSSSSLLVNEGGSSSSNSSPSTSRRYSEVTVPATSGLYELWGSQGFSMFSDEVAAAGRVESSSDGKLSDKVVEDQQEQVACVEPNYLLESPFDFSYSKLMHFAQTPPL